MWQMCTVTVDIIGTPLDLYGESETIHVFYSKYFPYAIISRCGWHLDAMSLYYNIDWFIIFLGLLVALEMRRENSLQTCGSLTIEYFIAQNNVAGIASRLRCIKWMKSAASQTYKKIFKFKLKLRRRTKLQILY